MAKSTAEKRAEDRRLFTEEVRTALHDACVAAIAGFEAFKQENPSLVDSQGSVLAEIGSTLVLVSRPSYRLRAALKALGEIDSPDPRLGGWSLRSLPPHVGQALIAQNAACSAAVNVLAEHFPGERHFWCRPWEN